jgi:hypothetical protein
VRADALIALLQDFYRARTDALVGHEAAARGIADYDANNAYQYVIAREETHLTWIADAIRDLGGEVPAMAAPATRMLRTGAERALADEDAKQLAQEITRWEPLVDEISNERHRLMLKVTLGEMREHRRFFEQAAAGRDDLLGSRAADAGQGSVLPTRWLE